MRGRAFSNNCPRPDLFEQADKFVDLFRAENAFRPLWIYVGEWRFIE
jgi:hypothetical protein